MFQHLDASIAALLEAELPQLAEDVTFSFVGPDQDFPPSTVSLPAISFFLYDIRENTESRSTSWVEQWRENDPPTLPRVRTRTRAPVRVSCSYLITAWPGGTPPSSTEDEHRLLGEVLRVLLRHRQIPAEHLQGDLAGQEPPLRTQILADNQLHSLGEFWQAMGGRPKAALHYGITLSLGVFEPVDVGPQVHVSMIRPGPENL